MKDIKKLKSISRDLRIKTLDMAVEYDNGHIAPAYSIIEILAVLYESVLTKQDKFILSKGHAALSYYCMLRKKEYNPVISGHPDIDINNGIECTTGSLGHGIAIGAGIAFARKIQNKKGHIYVLLGDGECQEGSVWEAANLARHFKLDNLTAIIDSNKLQALGSVKDILSDDNLAGKFKAFGSNVVRTDGHNLGRLLKVFGAGTIKHNMPRVIIADTVKGKGLKIMENVAKWHNCIPTGAELKNCYKELKK